MWSYFIIFDYSFLSLSISYFGYWIEPFIHDLDGKDWLLLSLIFSINTSSSSSSSSSMVHISISTNKKCSLIFNYKSQCEISKSKYSNCTHPWDVYSFLNADVNSMQNHNLRFISSYWSGIDETRENQFLNEKLLLEKLLILKLNPHKMEKREVCWHCMSQLRNQVTKYNSKLWLPDSNCHNIWRQFPTV